MAEYQIRHVEGGYELTLSGKTVVVLKGAEGSLKAEFASGTRDAAQDCFDKCFAASDGTTGAAHKCAAACGLT